MNQQQEKTGRRMVSLSGKFLNNAWIELKI